MGISEEEIALCEALRVLAGEEGEVSHKDLHKTLDLRVAGIIEKKLGSGPWQMCLLEQLINNEDILCTSENAVDAATSDASAVEICALDTLANDALADDASKESGGPSEWRTKELTGLHNLLDEVLKKAENEEDFMGDITEDAELDARKIQRGIMHHVVMPLRGSPLNSSGGAEVLWKARMQQLPRAVDELSSLLQKSLRLACLCGMQHKQQRNLQPEGQVQHDEQVQTMLEATIVRLTAARQSAQEKEDELIKLRHHVDLLFSERARQDELVQTLEAQIQKAETQRNAVRSLSPETNEMALAAKRSDGDLRLRLSTAELALDDAKEASASKDHRIAELETQLRELEQSYATHVCLDFSSGQPRSRMQRSNSALESLGGTHTPREDGTVAVQASFDKGRRGLLSSPLSVLNAKLEDLEELEKPVKGRVVGQHQAQFFDMAAGDVGEKGKPLTSARDVGEKDKPLTSSRRGNKKRVSTSGNLHGKDQKTKVGVGAMPEDLMSLGRLLSVSDSSGNLLDAIFRKK